MSKTLRNILSLVSNVIVVTILTYVMVIYLYGRGGINPRGPSCFAYYTTDSNLIYAIFCLISIPFNILTIVRKENKIPKWITLIRFYGTTIVSVTFFVVLFLLAPLAPGGFISLYEGMPFYLHLIVPVLAMISFICFDLYNEIEFKQLFLNLIITLTYGLFYVLWVFAFKQKDIYTFFAHGPFISVLIYVGIFSLCFGLGALLRYLNKIRNKEKKKRN